MERGGLEIRDTANLEVWRYEAARDNVAGGSETALLVFLQRIRDHEAGCMLGGIAFWIPPVASEANVQNRLGGRHVRNNPKEELGFRIEDRGDAHGVSLPAIDGQPNFHLTPSQVYWGEL
jgi:hypothetical protein